MKQESKVFVVDDNDDFRSSVAWMLRGGGYKTVEFVDGEKAITALRMADESDIYRSCLLLDVRMPRMSGIEFHEHLNQANIRIPIVYMTGHADVALAVEAMKKGAITLLEKPLKPDQLTNAIETAINSSIANSNTLFSSSVNQSECGEFLKKMDSLTPRERDVFNAMVEGQVNKQIATNLDISVRTVEVHRARLMKKLEVRTASEAVKMVLLCQMKH